MYFKSLVNSGAIIMVYTLHKAVAQPTDVCIAHVHCTCCVHVCRVLASFR